MHGQNQNHYPIFISYRRSDLSLEAEWLYNIIRTFFGHNAVFFDKNEIQPGARWDETLRTCVSEANIILILIGPKWFTEQLESGRRRLDDPEDWVRQEVKAAIKSFSEQPATKKIFTVLINCSGLPKKEWFPEDLAELVAFQTVKELHFDIGNYLAVAHDVYNLIFGEFTRLIQSGLWSQPILPFDYPKVVNPYDFSEYQLPYELRFSRPAIPFKGLEFFKSSDSRVFFGRKKEIGEIIDLFKKSQNFIRLYGQSGIGKSSLLFAGLAPRLQFNNWKILYVRIGNSSSVLETISKPLDEAKGSSDHHLIILDQVEEIITNPFFDTDLELNNLSTAVKSLMDSNKKREKKIRLILSYRKEYDVEIKAALAKKEVSSNEYWLKDMDDAGMKEAITGLARDKDLFDTYHLTIEKGLDEIIVKELLAGGSKENTTPLLQVLLRKMWDKVNHLDIDQRRFTRALYEECKNKDLKEYLHDRLQLLATKWNDLKLYVESGLAMDLLRWFVTDADTTIGHKEKEILNRYDQDPLILVKLTHALIDAYLLIHNNDDFRLPHDSLAKTIRVEFGNSILPGQRASKLLDSKAPDIVSGAPVEFSKFDLTTIKNGRIGMRKLTIAEEQVIKQNNERIEKADSEKRELAEQVQREELKRQFEQSEIDSIKVSFDDRLCEDIEQKILYERCLIITGSHFVKNPDNVPTILPLYQALKEKYSGTVTLDDVTELFFADDKLSEFNLEYDLKSLIREFGLNYLPSTLLARIPVKCYLNFFFDEHLVRVFQRENLNFWFDYNSEYQSNGHYLPPQSYPIIYNLLGSEPEIPLSTKTMDAVVNNLIKNDFPDYIREIFRNMTTIIFLDINWNSYYNQILARYILENCLKYRTNKIFAINNTLNIENVRFLKSLNVIVIDATSQHFLRTLYNKFDVANKLRIQH